MSVSTSKARLDVGAEMHALATELFPICRSITGNGLRETLARLSKVTPLTVTEVPTGTAVLDWTIPNEWNIREAWVANRGGERLIDFASSNLHVVNYSEPVRQRIRFDALRPRLHTLPDRPKWIPYRTSYYRRDWGFCLAHDDLKHFTDQEYDVVIDSTLAPGALSYGELLIPGQSTEEFLISAHCCHPSLANDNLSGMVVAVTLARALLQRPTRRLSYRFLFAPGTIGAIAWLAANEATVARVKHGLVLTCLGDDGAFTFKRSRRGNSAIDAAAAEVLSDSGAPHRLIDFSPYGYDERQFCSPAFNLPVGCLMRSEYGTFPEYHTSGDNLDFIKPTKLGESLETVLRIIDSIERHPAQPDNREDRRARPDGVCFINLKPKGEPQLGKYGFYEAFKGEVMPGLWVLSFSDGKHGLHDIARRSMLSFDSIANAADILSRIGLIREGNSN